MDDTPPITVHKGMSSIQVVGCWLHQLIFLRSCLPIKKRVFFFQVWNKNIFLDDLQNYKSLLK